MDIAFYAPLKSPDHPVPSGDRLMARLLIAALERAGHRVTVISPLRSFSRAPGAGPARAEIDGEIERIRALWHKGGVPDLWFTYHLYYKAPDWLGPSLAQACSLPYVTAEASWSKRRDGEGWAANQSAVLDAVRQAAVNICLTRRDQKGLIEADCGANVALLPPFIDGSLFAALPPAPVENRLITVAMMRPGDKFDSYRALATALQRVRAPFSLTIIGDGPCRDAVEALFAPLGPQRVTFLGECSRDEVAALLSTASLYVWPGCGEAYGLAFLEAQAAGLPVVAFRTAGVPEVVEHDVSGILTPDGDAGAYAAAISHLLGDAATRHRLARKARRFALEERSLETAARNLDVILHDLRKSIP